MEQFTLSVVSQRTAGPIPYRMTPAEEALRKRARDDMAEVYRKMRAHSPAMARILYQRMRTAEAELMKEILGFG